MGGDQGVADGREGRLGFHTPACHKQDFPFTDAAGNISKVKGPIQVFRNPQCFQNRDNAVLNQKCPAE